MFNTAELLAASSLSIWPSHCRFPTINWPTVSNSLNNTSHTKSEEGFTLNPLGRDTLPSLTWPATALDLFDSLLSPFESPFLLVLNLVVVRYFLLVSNLVFLSQYHKFTLIIMLSLSSAKPEM